MKNKELVSKMTLQEKAAILSGRGEWDTWPVERLGIPSMFLSDGPSGVRKQAGAGDHLGINPSVPATCFPSAAALANSWDEDLAEEVGRALGSEAAAEEVNVLLAPGLNIKRNPLCGRNFEYLSEDPFLSGKMAAAIVRGIQSQGPAACVKHFAVNSQEERRMAMNAVVDERTLREIYLTGFEIAVKEGNPRTLMSSYNEVNGIYANENEHLLMEILRGEWGFDGMVVTDWGASNDHPLGVKNGSNLEMPAPGLDAARELIAAVEAGRISEEDIDARVDELLTIILETDEAKKTYREGPGKELDKEALHAANHQIARKAAAGSMVLLKNKGELLPLSPGSRVALIGDFADKPRYQGAGSSMVNSHQVDSVMDVIDSYDLNIVGYAKGYLRDGKEDAGLIEDAVALAREADIVLYFFGLNEQSESEGLDRTHLRIPQNQIDLLAALSDANPRVVGIISAGSVIEMSWEKDLAAILHSCLSGQAGAMAVCDVLTGKVNPSGHLNETTVLEYADTPSASYYPAKERNSEYREGLYVGYRYFTTAGTAVRYPFGYGLSYTSFAYSDLEIDKKGVSFQIENTGQFDGAEVAQLYIGLPASAIFRPVRELKGFKKVFLKAGESTRVHIPFDEISFRYWNADRDSWEVEEGDYRIEIGRNAEQIELMGSIYQEGSGADIPDAWRPSKMPSYYSGHIKGVGDAEYEYLLGHEIPDGSWEGELGRNDALCQLSYSNSWIGRKIYRVLDGRLEKARKKGEPDLNTLFQYNMPFRAIAKMTGGLVSMEMVDALVSMVNGHGGFWKIVGGYFRNKKLNKAHEEELTGKKQSN